MRCVVWETADTVMHVSEQGCLLKSAVYSIKLSAEHVCKRL